MEYIYVNKVHYSYSDNKNKTNEKHANNNIIPLLGTKSDNYETQLFLSPLPELPQPST